MIRRPSNGIVDVPRRSRRITRPPTLGLVTSDISGRAGRAQITPALRTNTMATVCGDIPVSGTAVTSYSAVTPYAYPAAEMSATSHAPMANASEKWLRTALLLSSVSIARLMSAKAAALPGPLRLRPNPVAAADELPTNRWSTPSSRPVANSASVMDDNTIATTTRAWANIRQRKWTFGRTNKKSEGPSNTKHNAVSGTIAGEPGIGRTRVIKPNHQPASTTIPTSIDSTLAV